MLPFSYLSRVWMGSKMSPKLLPTTVRPLSAHVKLTENCQAKCISCDYWKTRWQDEISTDRAVELLNEITDAGIGTLAALRAASRSSEKICFAFCKGQTLTVSSASSCRLTVC